MLLLLSSCFYLSPADLADRLKAGEDANAPGVYEVVADTDTDTDTDADTDADADADADTDADTGTAPPTDADGDGHFTPDDCNDADPAIHPGAIEVCDLIDNNCDWVIDEDSSVDALPWYADTDGDGYGDGEHLRSCNQIPGYTWLAGDCNDDDSSVNPDALEDCSTSGDDNCDGTSDAAGALNCTSYYVDADGDGLGTGATLCACEAAGALVAGDCDDGDAAVTGPATWYYDGDGDGYGALVPTADACTEPADYAATDDDCDDTTSGTHPGAYDIPEDGIDEDCDGLDPCGGVTLSPFTITVDFEDYVTTALSTTITVTAGCATGVVATSGESSTAYSSDGGCSAWAFTGVPTELETGDTITLTYQVCSSYTMGAYYSAVLTRSFDAALTTDQGSPIVTFEVTRYR